jgi:hypothetical protein
LPRSFIQRWRRAAAAKATRPDTPPPVAESCATLRRRAATASGDFNTNQCHGVGCAHSAAIRPALIASGKDVEKLQPLASASTGNDENLSRRCQQSHGGRMGFKANEVRA